MHDPTILFGCETEFAILDGWAQSRAICIHCRAVAGRPALHDLDGLGVFLGNGARVYIDHGRHNEYCTPECTDPLELLACELAGRRIMAAAAAEAGLRLLLTNHDPGRAATWGTHENYCCRAPLPHDLGLRLDTHLVTRVLFAGAGGIDPGCPRVRPVFSPRACLLAARRARQDQLARALVYDKPRHHGAGWRLHVMAGESLLSQFAGYLKVATTALVVALLDCGIAVGPGPFAGPPLVVLRRLNRDLGLEQRFRMADGRRLTGLEVQRCMLDSVAGRLGMLPGWAPGVVGLWAEALEDAAAGGAAGARPRLDWAVYQLGLAQLAGEFGGWDVAGLRAAACELHLRLRVLGAGSWFDELDAAGALGHRLPQLSEAAVVRAVDEAPPGRARLRAGLVREFGCHGPDHRVAAGLRLGWDVLHGVQQVLRIPDEAEPGWRGNWQREGG